LPFIKTEKCIGRRKEYSSHFTDDATIFEKAGFKVNLIEGEENNIKITTTRDLEFAEYLSSK
jgi:2-C-methyl-D-erythritol 4-phosphate cytidylyltransferase